MPVILIVQASNSADIGKTLDGIAADMRLSLEGEVQDLAGVLNNNANHEIKTAQFAQGVTTEGDWGYYAKQIAGVPRQFLSMRSRMSAGFTECCYMLLFRVEAQQKWHKHLSGQI